MNYHKTLMKKLLILFTLISILITGCNKEEENINSLEKGDLIFSLALSQEYKNVRKLNTLPANSSIRLSILDSEESPILINEIISIIKINNEWMSEAISLPAGNYTLTEFIILTAENEVLYAVPVDESPLSKLVSHPLPLNFEVSSNEVSNLNLELLNAINLNPADIGYVAFPFTLVDYFFISVFADEKSELNFTDASAYIIQNSDTIKSYSILPEINTLTFTKIDSGKFTLVVVKSGFAKYSQEFTITEILENYENGIVSVNLIPAFTFIAVPIFYDGITDTESNFEISLGFQGDILIDWGDGVFENSSTSGNDIYKDFYHKYDKEGFYFVSVTGDIQNLKSFYSFYSSGPIYEINLKNLPELIDFSLGFLGGLSNPKEVDFSYNHKLQSINMANNWYLEKIIIPENNVITSLSIPGPNQINTSTLEQIVSKIYESAIQNNRQEGYIGLSIEGEDNLPVTGPPSEYTLVQLRYLKKNLNWYIYPDPEI